jgi:hypothetical protein
MGAEGDRGKRAGDYILGLMGEAERERAERDLEFDPAFRDAVMRLAGEMRLFDRTEAAGDDAGERWRLVAARIAELPQMRAAGMAAPEVKPFIVPSRRRAVGMGLHALPNRRAMVTALGLIAAFALGYLVAKL